MHQVLKELLCGKWLAGTGRVAAVGGQRMDGRVRAQEKKPAGLPFWPVSEKR